MSEKTEMIGNYKVDGIIAEGGMGTVYKAEHPSLKRSVVIKKLSGKGTAENRERFKREAQLLLDMQSPYIVHLFDYFTEGSYRYMVEEYVDGMALDKLIQKQKGLGPQISLLILLDACYALKYAHAKGVIHRDIKPANILVSRRAEVKLTDFGIATADDDEKPKVAITQTGTMLGTPAYMPPEQFEDSRKVDQRADIYALGVTLYEMITGVKPYPANFSPKTLALIQKGDYLPPSKFDRSIPRIFDRLIKKMMCVKPENRFQSVDPVIVMVKEYLEQYDTHALRLELAKAVISSKPFKIRRFRPHRHIILTRLFKAAAVCAAVTVFFIGLWESGLLHGTVLRYWYTPVKVMLDAPQGSSSGRKADACFYYDEKNRFPEVPWTRRTFSHSKTGYHIRTVYLRKGRYRVKASIGPYLIWRTVEVGKEKKTVMLSLPSASERPLSLHVKAFNARTEHDITSKTVFTVFYNNRWVLLDQVSPGELRSGTEWKIQASCAGYRVELFSLVIDWYQDEVFITADLEPAS